MRMIYFDNSATTFPKPLFVYEKMDEAARTIGVNAGRGGYSLANQAAELVDETRQLLADLVNISDYRKVVINPSATIALNSVLFGINFTQGDNVYYSPFEHNSVLRPLEILKKRHNLNLIQLPVNPFSLEYELDKTQKMFKTSPPRLVVVNHASNICGIIAPIKELTSLAHNSGAIVLVDGAQALGALLVNLQDVKCDFYVFAGHKNLYGPFGVGGVFINNDNLLEPYIYGGTGSNSEELYMPEEYPGILEAGSPNIIAIAGLNAGVKWLKHRRDLLEKENELFVEMAKVLSRHSEIQIVGGNSTENRLPIISCKFDGYTPQEIEMILDQKFNIAVRAGLHCAPLAHKFLGTFLNGTVRFSLGYFNSKHEIALLNEIFFEIFA